MSVFDRQGPSLDGAAEGAGDDRELPGSDGASGPAACDNEQLRRVQEAPPFDPHRDARALVRLIQCQRCSMPLQQPMTLACGNSLCRRCLPELHKREHITYPATRGRAEGFMCPFADCGREHSMGDCSNDVTLSKLLEQVSVEIAGCRPSTSDTPTLLEERLHTCNEADSSADQHKPHSRLLNGGRLVATYTMVELGELQYEADVVYQTWSPTGDNYQHLDYGMLDHLREVTRNELDCQVCFALMLDPLTLSCGHTFCRKCVARVLDHSQTCPACRRPLILTPGALETAHSNKRLSELLLALCPEQIAARVQQVEAEEAELAQKQQIPLFICTLAYPRIPTFLHIFEPRYRLMIRRAMETDRRFGMLAYNSKGEPQGELGSTQFMQYGTLLEIINMHLFPNGRSVIETVGVSRFCVREYGMRDGYTVGRVERIDDISVADEEALEARQVSSAVPSSSSGDTNTDPVFMTPAPLRGSSESVPALENIPTTELMDICTAFIHRMRSASAHWLSDHIIQAYGPMPDDPAVFPYWFASVLPINETEKYRLLPTRNVRTRLMICAEWVGRVERTRWYARLRELMGSGSLAVLASSHEDADNNDEDNDNDDDNDEEIEQPLPQDDTATSQQESILEAAVSDAATSEASSEPPTIPTFEEAAGLAASLLVALEAPMMPPWSDGSVETPAQPESISQGSQPPPPPPDVARSEGWQNINRATDSTD